ncbi:MAG: glycosyltransferase family 2 protein [Ignavibacteriales bacterium]
MKFLKKVIKKIVRTIVNESTYDFEVRMHKMYNVLEYKIYEFNNNTNQLLYDIDLRLKKIEMKNLDSTIFNPKVSIIIPVYNGEKYLGQAIDSALSQTYKNIEIIVVNDGSNDDGATEKIAKSYKNRIRYLKKENGGVSSALNYGIKNMTGEYFAWLSHDDIYLPNNIETHIEYLANISDRNVVTYTNFNIVDKDLNILLDQTVTCNLHCFDYKMTKLKPEYALLQGEINGGSVLISKKILDEVGLFNEKLRISQEREMWSRIMPKYRFVSIPIATTLIRSHGEQVTNTNEKVIIETNEARKKIIDNIPDEVKINLEGSMYNFYTVMRRFYSNNCITEMVEYIDKKIEELKINNKK